MENNFLIFCNYVGVIAGASGGLVAIITYIKNAVNKSKGVLDKRELERLEPHMKLIAEQTANEVADRILKKMDKIQNSNEEQNKILNIQENVLQDTIRQKIEEIYYTYEDTQQLPLYVWEHVQFLYADYVTVHGNHHVETLYNRMKHWEKVNIKPPYEK